MDELKGLTLTPNDHGDPEVVHLFDVGFAQKGDLVLLKLVLLLNQETLLVIERNGQNVVVPPDTEHQFATLVELSAQKSLVLPTLEIQTMKRLRFPLLRKGNSGGVHGVYHFFP